MQDGDHHPTHAELLLHADGELSRRDERRLKEHLTGCWECRTRLREMEEAIGDYVQLHRRTLDPMLPSADGPRALLKAQMRELAAPGARRDWIGLSTWRYAVAGVVALCIAGYIGLSMRTERAQGRLAIPDARLTPGVAAATNREAVCGDLPPNNRRVSTALQRKVFAVYGMDHADPGKYEVDYLITPALGGADDIRNLWPQPYAATTWNAHVKDALENRLYELVCTGSLDLATAQQDISRDWISAYKHYFHTERPIAGGWRDR